MLYFLTTRKKCYTLDPFFNEWVPEINKFARIVTYEDLVKQKQYPAGVYIFTDIDSLSPPVFHFTARLAERLVTSYGELSVLNHPWKVLKRRQLLELLKSRGKNEFSVHALASDFNAVSFPAFIRKADRHTGPLTELVNSPAELRAAVKKLLRSGIRAEELLIVEFCDTRSDDDYFRKYTAFVLRDKVMPRYVSFSRDWVVKNQERAENTQHQDEHARYLAANPHEDQIRSVFGPAGIDYGRVDYGMKDGRMQVWEINVNPFILRKKSAYNEIHLQKEAEFARLMMEELLSLDGKITPVMGTLTLAGISNIKRRYIFEKTWSELKETLRLALPKEMYGAIEYYRLPST